MNTYIAREINEIWPLRNHDYYIFLLSAISQAKKRIWGNIFIIDVTVSSDQRLFVRKLINSLGFAKWRGVDVRIIVGKSESTPDIQIANTTSAQYMKLCNIDVKSFYNPKNQSTHSKYIIFDSEIIVLGSHNWTHGGFANHIEDSVAIRSLGLCKNLEVEFQNIWNSSRRITL